MVWLSVVLQTTSVYQEGLGLLFLFAGLWDVQWCCSGSAVPLVKGGHWAPTAGDSQEQPGWMFWTFLQPALSGRGALRLWKAPVKAVSSLCEWTGACWNRFSLGRGRTVSVKVWIKSILLFCTNTNWWRVRFKERPAAKGGALGCLARS